MSEARGARIAGRALAVRGLCALLAVAASAGLQASQRFAARGEIELAFVPGDEAEKLVLDVIRRARRSLEVQAYVFTSQPIADAMVAAHRRGVKVEVLADAKMNRQGKGKAIPRLLAAGVPVAFETQYAAAHNKVLIADAEGPGCAVLTGSYNFTWSARERNAENLLVLRDHCALARAYRDNWRRHRAEATPVKSLPWRR